MRLVAKAVRISRAKFHCNRLITVQDIQAYESLMSWDTSLYNLQTGTITTPANEHGEVMYSTMELLLV